MGQLYVRDVCVYVGFIHEDQIPRMRGVASLAGQG